MLKRTKPAWCSNLTLIGHFINDELRLTAGYQLQELITTTTDPAPAIREVEAIKTPTLQVTKVKSNVSATIPNKEGTKLIITCHLNTTGDPRKLENEQKTALKTPNKQWDVSKLELSALHKCRELWQNILNKNRPKWCYPVIVTHNVTDTGLALTAHFRSKAEITEENVAELKSLKIPTLSFGVLLRPEQQATTTGKKPSNNLLIFYLIPTGDPRKLQPEPTIPAISLNRPQTRASNTAPKVALATTTSAITYWDTTKLEATDIRECIRLWHKLLTENKPKWCSQITPTYLYSEVENIITAQFESSTDITEANIKEVENARIPTIHVVRLPPKYGGHFIKGNSTPNKKLVCWLKPTGDPRKLPLSIRTPVAHWTQPMSITSPLAAVANKTSEWKPSLMDHSALRECINKWVGLLNDKKPTWCKQIFTKQIVENGALTIEADYTVKPDLSAAAKQLFMRTHEAEMKNMSIPYLELETMKPFRVVNDNPKVPIKQRLLCQFLTKGDPRDGKHPIDPKIYCMAIKTTNLQTEAAKVPTWIPEKATQSECWELLLAWQKHLDKSMPDWCCTCDIKGDCTSPYHIRTSKDNLTVSAVFREKEPTNDEHYEEVREKNHELLKKHKVPTLVCTKIRSQRYFILVDGVRTNTTYWHVDYKPTSDPRENAEKPEGKPLSATPDKQKRETETPKQLFLNSMASNVRTYLDATMNSKRELTADTASTMLKEAWDRIDAALTLQNMGQITR